MLAHRWQQLEGLDHQSSNVDFDEINSLHQQWLNFRKQREDSDPNAYRDFLERVDRRWAIETGIIEGIYNIDVGTTQTLVQNGLLLDLIEPTATDRDPHDLVRVLKDHQTSAEYVTESIRRRTPFSGHFIRQLHQLLTRNQLTYTAVDQFGRSFETPLDRGGFKNQPNNPMRPDGSIHEYCPPVHVVSEVERLVSLCKRIQDNDDSYHGLLVAAWLHHRFTQIHPFQDGNGRVARALLTWHLAKEDYLPVVVSRDDRKLYIECLELADAGDLDPFVQFIVKLERRMILEALGEPAPVIHSGMVSQILDHITDRVRQQHQAQLAQRRLVNSVAEVLQDAAKTHLESQAEPIIRRLSEAGLAVESVIDWGGPSNKEHWYRAQLVKTASDMMHWANLNESRFFIKLSINPEDQSRTPRLIFVVSLHHVGRQLTGIMAATAFAQIVNYQDYSTEGSEELSDPAFRNCTIESFTFTWEDNAEAIVARFVRWMDGPMSMALRHWSEFIS